MENIKSYGLSDSMIEYAKVKVKYSKSYLKKHGVILGDKKIVPFSDFVQNTFVNPDRYLAELQHRAWSIYNYAMDRGLANIFFTLTLPSNWHKEKYHKNKLIPNKTYGGRYIITSLKHPISGQTIKLKNSEDNIKKYSPYGASKELSKLLRKIYDSRWYKGIQKEDRVYFRAIEPHADGTPHTHVSFFVPHDKVEKFISSTMRMFPYPQCEISTTHVPDTYTYYEKCNFRNGKWVSGYKLNAKDKNFISQAIENPISYLMKYVLKTLDDLREDSDNLSNISYWYLYHGISRFYTSKLFIPLEIYRRLNGMYTIPELTDAYLRGDVQVNIRTDNNKIANIQNEYGYLYVNAFIIDTFSDRDWRNDVDNDEYEPFNYEFKTVYAHKDETALQARVEVIIDGVEYQAVNIDEYYKSKNKFSNYLHKVKLNPLEQGDYELFNYFNSLDIETVNFSHYAVTRNMLITRGLLHESYIKPSEFTKEYFDKPTCKYQWFNNVLSLQDFVYDDFNLCKQIVS